MMVVASFEDNCWDSTVLFSSMLIDPPFLALLVVEAERAVEFLFRLSEVGTAFSFGR